MFVLNKDHSYTWPVTVKVPVAGGKHDGKQFTCRFRVVPQNRLQQILAEEEVDAAMLHEALIGWDGVQDEAENPLPFNDENRDALLDIPYVAIAVARAYFESITGDRFKAKKLIDAARHWASGGGQAPSESAARDLAAWGAPEEVIEAWWERQRQTPFEVLESNAEALALFLACATQWRLAGMEAVPVGLDYAGVAAAANGLGMALAGGLFEGIQIMERAALDVLLERRGSR